MNKQYFEVLGRLRAKHGTRFNPPQGVDHLIPYFGMRCVEVTGKYEVRRGRIGITTGWAPALLLLHNATSIGSSDLRSNTMQRFTIEQLSRFVDTLGAMKAAAADLDRQMKDIQETLKASGLKEINGAIFRATISVTERMSLDAEAVKELLVDPPMKSSIVETVRIVARVSK